MGYVLRIKPRKGFEINKKLGFKRGTYYLQPEEGSWTKKQAKKAKAFHLRRQYPGHKIYWTGKLIKQ